jgi:hypothetical protein
VEDLPRMILSFYRGCSLCEIRINRRDQLLCIRVNVISHPGVSLPWYWASGFQVAKDFSHILTRVEVRRHVPVGWWSQVIAGISSLMKLRLPGRRDPI